MSIDYALWKWKEVPPRITAGLHYPRFGFFALGLILGFLFLISLPAFPEPPADEPAITITGVLQEVIVEDPDFRSPGLLLMVLAEPDGRLLQLRAPATARLPLGIGDRLLLKGRLRNEEIWIEQDNVRVLSAAAERKTSAASATGSRRLAALLINFSRLSLGPNCSKSAVESILFSAPDSVARFYEEASFGQLHFPPDSDGDGQADVFGPFTIDLQATSCDFNEITPEADAAAAAAGVDLALYDHVVYVLPAETACVTSGTLGCIEPYCRSWIRTFPSLIKECQYKSIFAHEIGHNLGMNHASTDLDADGFVDDPGEYGDVSDVMGLCCATFPQPNAPHKLDAGWFSATPARVVNVPSDGGPYTYTLASIEENPATTGNPQILRLADWYLSTRSAVGFDSTIDTYEHLKFVGRTNVHRYDPLYPYPMPRTFLTALLGDGDSFTDEASGYQIVQLSHTPSSVTVQVRTPGICVEDAHTACLLGGRFKVQIDWLTAASSGPASVMEFSYARAESDESAFWSFFSPTNFEIGTKVLDACALNQKFWVFLGGLTDQGFTVRVTDIVTGATKTYTNPLGQTAVTVTDTSAFDCN